MLSNSSLSKLTGTVGHTAFSENVGTGIIAQINYSFSVTLLPQRKAYMTVCPQETFLIPIFERLFYILLLSPCFSIHIYCDKSKAMYTNIQVLTSQFHSES